MKSRLLIAIRYLVAVGLVYWLTQSGMVDWNALRDRLRDWQSFLLPFTLLVAGMVTMSWRLTELLRGRGLVISIADAVRLTLVANLFTLVLPAGGGDVARFYYASSSASGRRTEVAAIMVMDRVVGLATLLVTPLLAWPLLGDLSGQSTVLQSILVAAALTAAAVIGGLALIIVPPGGVAAPLAWILDRLAFRHVRELFVGAIRGYRDHPAALGRAVLASLLTHLLIAVAFSVLYLHGSGARVLVFVLSLLGFVVNSLPLTPGGIGVGEAAFEVLFSQAGLPGGAEALLSWRVLMLALAPVGLLIHLRGLRIALASPSR
jgi:uncharacterized membrane protein YbhN (UPF0104 family)